MPKKAVKRSKRSKNYDPKLELDEGVGFDDLFKVAINYDPKKKKATPAKKKKK